MAKLSMSYLFSFSRYKTKCVIKFLFRQLDDWQAEKKGKVEIQQFEYLANEKSFVDEIKNIFQFLKGYHLVKNENFLKNSGHKL